MVPLYVRAAWLFPDVIDDPLASVNLNLKWFLEPWIAGVTSTKQNAVEFGITPIGLKLEYDAGQQVVPYLIAGTGVMYTGLGGYELSGPFEFASFGGAGIELFSDRPAGAELLVAHPAHLQRGHRSSRTVGSIPSS